MKIIGAEIFDISPTDIRPYWHPVVIRVKTDEGIDGLGEIGLAYGAGHSAGAGMLKDLFECCLMGEDPFNTEKIWETMLRSSFWGLGGGPVIYGALSAIDIALWDIKGKTLNLPVCQLLGGKTHDRLRTYASQIQFGWDRKSNVVLIEPQQYGEAALKAAEEGYDCVKVDPVLYDGAGNRNYNLSGVLPQQILRSSVNRVKAVRDAVGDDVDIIVELHSAMSATTAIQLARELEPFKCMYLEEPVHFMDVDVMAKVADQIKIPLAGGERIYTRWGFHPYLEKKIMDVIQPDLGLAGGFTEVKKVCDFAHIFDATVQAHVCGGPIATAASLQLEAAIPNFCIHEHHTYALKDGNRVICQEDFQPREGFFEVPDSPGIGISLNDDFLKNNATKISIKTSS